LEGHLLAPVLPDMKKPGAVSRPGAQPTGRNKKPIAGRPGIGAQFVSFNFPNTLIRDMVSSLNSQGLCAGETRHRRADDSFFFGAPGFDRCPICRHACFSSFLRISACWILIFFFLDMSFLPV